MLLCCNITNIFYLKSFIICATNFMLEIQFRTTPVHRSLISLNGLYLYPLIRFKNNFVKFLIISGCFSSDKTQCCKIIIRINCCVLIFI